MAWISSWAFARLARLASSILKRSAVTARDGELVAGRSGVDKRGDEALPSHLLPSPTLGPWTGHRFSGSELGMSPTHHPQPACSWNSRYVCGETGNMWPGHPVTRQWQKRVAVPSPLQPTAIPKGTLLPVHPILSGPSTKSSQSTCRQSLGHGPLLQPCRPCCLPVHLHSQSLLGGP